MKFFKIYLITFSFFMGINSLVLAENCGNVVYTGGNVNDNFSGLDTYLDPPDLPDLRVENIKIYRNDVFLPECTSFLVPGETIKIRTRIVSEENDCSFGTDSDTENIETDIYSKISLDQEIGQSRFLERVYTPVDDLTKDNYCNEYISYDIPLSSAGYRLYLKAKTDATEEVEEQHESDNWSGFDWYPILGEADLVITHASLTNNRTVLKEGESYGFEAIVQNQGNTPAPVQTRAGYYHQNPSQSNWELWATDGIDVSKLIPGRENYEYTKDEPFIAQNPGLHYLKICADCESKQPETDETNNCQTISFEVIMHRPDFIISDIYLKVGTSIIREGGRVKRDSYVQPYAVIKNIGNSNNHPGFRAAYYINSDTYRDSDGIDPNEIPVNYTKTEYVSPSSAFKLGDTGIRTYRCTADYQNKVLELNENNNSKTITFTVQ
jgi:hypothetical protein